MVAQAAEEKLEQRLAEANEQALDVPRRQRIRRRETAPSRSRVYAASWKDLELSSQTLAKTLDRSRSSLIENCTGQARRR